MIRHNFHKYGVRMDPIGKARRTVDGIVFDSKLEADYYRRLKVLRDAGDVLFFLRQVPFHLPGGVTYRVDFVEFHASGYVRFVDVKGKETKEFIRNKKQVEDLYSPVIIEVVKKA